MPLSKQISKKKSEKSNKVQLFEKCVTKTLHSQVILEWIDWSGSVLKVVGEPDVPEAHLVGNKLRGPPNRDVPEAPLKTEGQSSRGQGTWQQG